MNKLSCLACILLFFALTPVSGDRFVFTTGQLSARSQSLALEHDLHPYALPSAAGPLRGITLLELCPLMEYVYEFEIVTVSQVFSFAGDDLADEWGETFLVAGPRGGAVWHRGTLYEDLVEVRFSGELLYADSLDVWLSWEGTDTLRRELDRFARSHGFSVNASSVPSPEARLAAVVRARGEVPDLVMIQSSGLQSLVDARALQPLDYLDFPGIVPQGLRAFTLGDRQWAMPFYFDTQVVFYNRDLIPFIPAENWTLTAMEDYAAQLRDRNVRPLVWNAYSSNWLVPFQMSFGKRSLLEPDGTIAVDDTATLESLHYLIRLQEEGLLVPMERDAMDALFIRGDVGMILSGSYAIPYLEALGVDFGVLPFPVNQETGLPLSSLLDFKAFAMARQTRDPILARRVLQFLRGPGVQRRFCAEQHKLSVRQDLPMHAETRSVYDDMLAKTVDSGTVIPPDRIYGVYKNNMWKLLRFALSGQMSPEETLQAGQALMDADR